MNKRNWADVPPMCYLVALENTQYWNLERAFGACAEHIAAIYEVWLFDLSERTYICSLTPSVFGVYVYQFVEFKDDDKVDDEMREHVELVLGDNGCDDDYFDYAQIEHIVERGGKYVRPVTVTASEIEDATDAADPQMHLMNSLREYYQCNQVL